MTTKQELINWLTSVRDFGNSVYVALNGGGITLVGPDLIDNLLADINSDSYGEIEEIVKGDEYEDFSLVMSNMEYRSTISFIKVSYLSGYNQENHDYQIQYYEL